MREQRKKLANNNGETIKHRTCSERWTAALLAIQTPLLQPLVYIANHAALYPHSYIVSILLFSLGIFGVGLATNFATDTHEAIWTPKNSLSVQHGQWIEHDSGFAPTPRRAYIIVHMDGQNILGGEGLMLAKEGVERVFEALDTFRQTPGYDHLCSQSSHVEPDTNDHTCPIMSITGFWNDTTSIFLDQVASNDDAIETMSAETFPNGQSVERAQIVGYAAATGNDGKLNYGKSYVTSIMMTPIREEAETLEANILERMLALQDAWQKEEGNPFRLEVAVARSFDDEFERAVVSDIPLVPVVFGIMSIMCIIVFFNRDPVKSRSWLGFGAVVTVLLSITTSFGFLFLCGVPFTPLTQILPFILFGIALDDAFVIYGSYTRTSTELNPAERIRITMEDIGCAIFMTTMTTVAAFALGLLSTVPAVRWLVIYAFPTVIVDFVYQITFYVALIVVDERRIQDNRRDCLMCCKARSEPIKQDAEAQTHVADQLMVKYADFLLRRPVKIIVLVLFPILLGLCTWSMLLLEQHFQFTELLPSDSYVLTWWTAFNEYYEKTGARTGVYFRYVDFSSTEVQDEMDEYVNELAYVSYFRGQPFDFWLRDFKTFVNDSDYLRDSIFDDQITAFLEHPIYSNLYRGDVVLDENGTMTASRTTMNLDNVDYHKVTDQVGALKMERTVTAHQPVNAGKAKWAFFAFANDYYIWEFYQEAPREIVISFVVGTVTVSLLALIFIPHWSSIFFVGPMVAVLYIDLLGVCQWAGISVNPVMYIAMVMSIGLMVDFIMHIILRYLESTKQDREGKVKDTLGTMGASLMLGGLSTMLGVLPLAFAASEIFFTVFVVFFGLVTLGILHGLVLLPVILSLVGPEVLIFPAQEESRSVTTSNRDAGETETELVEVVATFWKRLPDGVDSDRWIRDFQSFVNSSEGIQDLPVDDQVAEFLQDPIYSQIHRSDNVMGENGAPVAALAVQSTERVDYSDFVNQVKAIESDISLQRVGCKWFFYTFTEDGKVTVHGQSGNGTGSPALGGQDIKI